MPPAFGADPGDLRRHIVGSLVPAGEEADGTGLRGRDDERRSGRPAGHGRHDERQAAQRTEPIGRRRGHRIHIAAPPGAVSKETVGLAERRTADGPATVPRWT